MKTSRFAALALLLSTSLVAPDADAGAWLPSPGHGYLKLWLKYLPGFWYNDGQGNRWDYGAYHELFANAYTEVGLVDGLAFWVHAPLVQAFGLEDTRARAMQWHVTPGDPTMGLRLRVAHTGRASIALDASVRAPVARAGVVQPVYAAAGPEHQQVGALRIGNGATDVGLSLSIGYAKNNWYVSGTVGAVYRSNNFDPAGTVLLEGGGRVARDRVGIRGRLTGFLSLPVGTAPRHESPSGMGNGSRYWGFALEADVRVAARWDVGLTIEGGAGPLVRQTGGPVLSLYAATTF